VLKVERVEVVLALKVTVATSLVIVWSVEAKTVGHTIHSMSVAWKDQMEGWWKEVVVSSLLIY
jgi:hypothetical protein